MFGQLASSQRDSSPKDFLNRFFLGEKRFKSYTIFTASILDPSTFRRKEAKEHRCEIQMRI